MKILDKIFGRKSASLSYEQIANLIDGGSGGMIAGQHVNAKTALQVATVLACVKVIAEGCATPDLHIYRSKADKKKELATNIPEYRLLNSRANEFQTSFEWRRMMTVHAALTGYGLSIKVKGFNGRLRELIPIAPGNWEHVETSRYDHRYRVWDKWGVIGEFKPEDVFILSGMQWEMGVPLDAIRLARNVIGLAAATEKSHTKFHENGIRPSGVYSVEGNLDATQYAALRAHLKTMAGPEKAGDPMVLDRSAKWLQTAMSGVDAQHVETRRLQIEEICRMYNVFPIMVMHSDKSATFASSEAFFSAHLIHTLKPWHKNWTDRIDETILDGAGPLYARFDTKYMREGNMVDRAMWVRAMIELGVYTRNDIREEDGKDPLPGLDEPLTPMNMQKGKDNANPAKT
ncbi:MAG TPA: phage portal protein [Methylophilaceae bacterium]|nr:phage portal protein [Methylophilaceae bacterium]